MPNKLDVSKLKQDSKRQAFVNDLCSRLDALERSSEDVDESWTVFRDTVHSSAMDSLGPVSRKHQDWFEENDKEIQGLLEEKHQKTQNLSAFRTFVRFVLVWICRFPLPLGAWEGLRFVIVALPGLFSYLSFFTSEISAQYLARLPIQTYARQFRRGSETCKTPG